MNNYTLINPYSHQKQNGAVLAVSLIILLVMTMLGVAGLQGTTIEEKMAGNLLDNVHAFQAAEAALREGETQLAGNAPLDIDASSWMHEANGLADEPVYKSTSNLTSSTDSNQYGEDLSGSLNSRPRYLIEELPVVEDRKNESLNAGKMGGEPSWYRVTAYGEGKSDKAVSIVQSIYQR